MASLLRIASCSRRATLHMATNFLAEVKQIPHGRFLRHTYNSWQSACRQLTEAHSLEAQFSRRIGVYFFNGRDRVCQRSLEKAGSNVNKPRFACRSARAARFHLRWVSIRRLKFGAVLVPIFSIINDTNSLKMYFYTIISSIRKISGCAEVIWGRKLVFLTPWAYRR